MGYSFAPSAPLPLLPLWHLLGQFFQRHGALSHLGLILPAPCPYGGPVSGISLLVGLPFEPYMGHWTIPLKECPCVGSDLGF